MASGATLSADPNPASTGGTTEICLKGAAASSLIQITCTDVSGADTNFKISTDEHGNGCHTFTIPSGWQDFNVVGGGAPSIAVLVT